MAVDVENLLLAPHTEFNIIISYHIIRFTFHIFRQFVFIVCDCMHARSTIADRVFLKIIYYKENA